MSMKTTASTSNDSHSTTIVCDNCASNLIIKMMVEKTPDGRFLDYFLCGHCKTRYNVSIITEKGIRFRDRLKSLSKVVDIEGMNYRRLKARMQKEIEKPKVTIIKATETQKASDTAS